MAILILFLIAVGLFGVYGWVTTLNRLSVVSEELVKAQEAVTKVNRKYITPLDALYESDERMLELHRELGYVLGVDPYPEDHPKYKPPESTLTPEEELNSPIPEGADEDIVTLFRQMKVAEQNPKTFGMIAQEMTPEDAKRMLDRLGFILTDEHKDLLEIAAGKKMPPGEASDTEDE